MHIVCTNELSSLNVMIIIREGKNTNPLNTSRLGGGLAFKEDFDYQ